MKIARETPVGTTLLVLSFCVVAAMLTPGRKVNAAEQQWGWLSPQLLDSLQVHLPSYMSSVQAILEYQAKNPLHQEIVLQWSGEANGQQKANGGFRMTGYAQHIDGRAPVGDLTPGSEQLAVIATTSDREVRGLSLCPDTRSTTGKLEILLPQDNQISKVILAHVSAGEMEIVDEVKIK